MQHHAAAGLSNWNGTQRNMAAIDTSGHQRAKSYRKDVIWRVRSERCKCRKSGEINFAVSVCLSVRNASKNQKEFARKRKCDQTVSAAV